MPASFPFTRVRVFVAAAVLPLLVAAGAPQASRTATAGPSPTSGGGPVVSVARLGGADPYGTAVAISRHRFPGTAKSVYLLSGARPTDAVALGAATDGPVLLVPPKGPAPVSVRAEVARLRPARVYAVGGASTLPMAVARSAAGKRPVTRIAGADRYATAVAVTRHLFPKPIHQRVFTYEEGGGDAPQVVLVDGSATLDGLLAGIAAGPSMAALPMPSHGPLPVVIKEEVKRLRLTHAAATLPVLRGAKVLLGPASGILQWSGPDRYTESVLLAYLGKRDDSADAPVYVARGDALGELAAAGPLVGPVLLVRPDGTVPHDVSLALRGARRIVLIGGVPDRAIAKLQAAALVRPPGP